MADKEHIELQRTNVAEFFKILDCNIHINIDRFDLKTAKYKYCYTIQILKQGLNEWREVFDYKKDEVVVTGAHDNEGGLKYKTENSGRYTTLTIDFRNHLSQGDKYYFDYEVETKIESISNIHRMLGGRGAVWFWCSHEFPIDSISAHFKLPNRVTATDTHPNGDINNGKVDITRTNLAPNEFFSGIIQVEKKLFGLNSAWGDRLYKLAWIVIGIILTYIFNYIIKIIQNGN